MRCIIIIIVFLYSTHTVCNQKKCLLINSYHKGYEWSDIITDTFKKNVDERCLVHIFYLNSKIKSSKKEIKIMAQNALNFYHKIKPDILIAVDDNAIKYFIVPFFKNTTIPIAFSGVNWSAAKYGFPWKNVSGMVELFPVVPVRNELLFIKENISKGMWISGDVSSSRGNAKEYKKRWKKYNILLDTFFVKTSSDWKTIFNNNKEKYDFIFLANNSGISNWHSKDIIRFLKNNTKIIITHHKNMMKYAGIGIVKKPEEQGLWIADLVKEYLKGSSPSIFPIVTGHQWNYYYNEKILNRMNIRFLSKVKARAIRVE